MHRSNSNLARLVDGHIPDSWILLSIDKELSSSDREFVEEHLRCCSRCSSVEQRLRDTIEQLREYNRVIVAPSASPSSSHKHVFEEKLHSLADQLAERRKFRFSIDSGALRKIADLLTPRNRILACGVLLLIVAFAVFRFNVPAVSANELLVRSDAFERNSLRGTRDPIIVQRILISTGGHQSERTLYRDLKLNRHVHEVSGSSEEDRLIDTTLQQAKLDADELIRPALFLRVSGEYPSSTVSVSQSGMNTVALAIHLSGFTITDADLTLRNADYHTIGARLRLSNQTTIQISELSYRVVQFETLRAGLFDLPAQNLTATVTKSDSSNTVSDLAGFEIQALSLLHGIHAELGGEMNIDDSDPRTIKIDGVVENVERKQEIENALRGVPAVQVNIETIAEKRNSLRPQVYESRGVLSATSTPPLLDKQLKEWFPASEDRREYVRAVLSYGQSASAHAWVLDELSNHFPPARCMALRSQERKDLNRLLQEEASSLSADLAGLRRQADMILVEPAAAPSSSSSPHDEHEQGLRRENAADWHDQVHTIHSALDRVNDNLTTLIVGAGAPGASSDHIRSETYQLLSGLSIDLQRFQRRLAQ